MNVSYVTGDIVEAIDQFDSPDKLHVAHGSNCFHKMGSGVAKSLVDRFGVHLVMADRHTVYGDINKLGGYSEFISPEGISVYNCYTQHNVREQYGVYVHWDSVRESLFSIIDEKMSDDDTLFIPKIGTGLAGGKEKDFLEVLNDVCHTARMNGHPNNIVVFSL